MADRATTFTCLVYPDSSPSNWLVRLEGLHLQSAVSPLHDRDLLSDGSGEYKKPHYHVVLVYNSLKSYRQVMADFDFFGGVYPSSEKGFEYECRVRHLPAMLRYLCHLDDLSKAQYSPKDVVTFGGLVYEDAIQDSGSFSRDVGYICDFAIQNDIRNFSQLVFMVKSEQPNWFPVLIRFSYFIRCFLSSYDTVLTPVDGFVPSPDLEV